MIADNDLKLKADAQYIQKIDCADPGDISDRFTQISAKSKEIEQEGDVMD